MVGLVVHSAGIQDRDGAPEVLKSIRYSHPNLRHIFADGGYAGPKLRDALEGIGDWTIQIVKRFDTAEGFEVIPGRRVVERTFAWLNRCRDWPKIGKNPSQVHRHGYSLHISEPSRVKLQGIVIMRRVLNQTLRCQRSLPSQTGACAADPSRQRLRAGGQLVHRAGVWPPSGGRQISWPIISGPLFTRSKRRGIPLCATLRNS